MIQVEDDLLIELVDGGLRVRRSDKAIVIHLGEVRHLVDALVKGADYLVAALVDAE